MTMRIGMREVEAAMRGVALLEVFDDAERVEIVVEAPAVTAQAAVESALACVTEGRMPDVVHQRESLGEVLVEAKRAGCGAGDLGHLDGVSKSAAKVIRRTAGEDLRLARKPAKCAGLHHALAIALKGSARGAKRRRIDAGQKRIAGISGDRASMEIECHSQLKV